MRSLKSSLHLSVLYGCLIALTGLLVRAVAQQDTAFLASAKNINIINSTVELPLYNATLADGSKAFYIVTEASTADAAKSLGVNHAAALDGLKDSSLTQLVRFPNAARTAPLKQQLQGIQVPHGVNFLYGKRSVVPDPKTGFPPKAATYSAQGNPGYSPLIQLPDGTVLNAPHVAVQYANGTLATHPKVVSMSLEKQTAVLQLTSGFSQGKPIVYISTEASDPLAATLENVPYVPSLAKAPTTALIDLVAFTNGQTGAKNPQRQGLGSAILDGLSPLNIPADTPASPAYSPLWAINLAKWVGPAGDRQTSFSAVQALSASGQVASFNPKDPNSNPPLAPSGIVVNCPIVAVVPEAVAAIDPQFGQTALTATQEKAFLASANSIDPISSTAELPLYNATLADGSKAFYIVTEASTADAAKSLGVNHAAALDGLKDSSLTQLVRFPNTARTAPLKQQLQGIQVPHGVNFLYGKRSVVPDPKTGFPPKAATYSAQGNPGYSPLIQLPDGTVLNAPHVAVQYANGTLAKHPKVVSMSLKKQTAVLQLTSGFSQGKPIVYISTEASDPLAATLENVPYVPSLAKAPTTALIDLVAFTNGQTGAKNPQRQGLGSAILDGLSPLNIPADTPASPAYSPLWAINLAKWVGPPGDRQTSFSAVQALSASGQVASFNPKDPNSNPPLAPSGIVVNCPIVAVVPDAVAAIDPQFGGNTGALRAGARSMNGDCTPSTLGYSCQVTAGPVIIHYTLGGPKPPANSCTSSSMPATGSDSATGSTAGLAHFAVQGNPPGYLAMSFAQNEGSMYPADAVLGYLDSTTSAPDVKSYHLSRYGISPSDETNGWAQNVGFSQQGGMKVLCFSRALDAPQAAVVKSINPNAATPMNWAIGSSDALMQHLQSGSLAISFAGGGVSGISDSGSAAAAATAVRIAHGVLMLTAFALMMPSAALAARHKWLFGSKDGKVKPVWFLTHRGLAMLAVTLALAAVILIFVQFRWAGRAATDAIYTPHRAVGMTAVAAMLVQGLLGAFRPHLNTQNRPVWRRVHQVWGAVTIALGLAASYMGIVLINKLSNIPMMYWLGPAVAVPVALLLMAVSLEYPKIKLQKQGIYDKEQHTLKVLQHADGSKEVSLNV